MKKDYKVIKINGYNMIYERNKLYMRVNFKDNFYGYQEVYWCSGNIMSLKFNIV